ACLTRYEAWPVTAAALAAAALARWRRGESLVEATRAIARVAVYPALAIISFTIFSRVVIGAWFVSGGFFVPENKALGDAALAAREIGWGAQMLSGPILTWVGGVGIAIVVLRSAKAFALRSDAETVRSAEAFALRSDAAGARRAEALIAASLLATAAIPWAAFYRGH